MGSPVADWGFRQKDWGQKDFLAWDFFVLHFSVQNSPKKEAAEPIPLGGEGIADHGRDRSGLQPSNWVSGDFLGRCPRLAWIGPSALWRWRTVGPDEGDAA